MSGWLARIRITLKPVVNDPAGASIADALHQLGFADVSGVRVGKYLEVELDAADREAAGEAAEAMCRRLLANPVIETYRFSVSRRAAR